MGLSIELGLQKLNKSLEYRHLEQREIKQIWLTLEKYHHMSIC